MKKAFLSYCATFLALTATGFVINSNPAVAQQTGDETEEFIVVEAPIEHHQVVGRTANGAKTEIIELTRQVSYADLDLRKYADVTEMETRIEASANESCEKLSAMFRLDDPTGQASEIVSCTGQAVNEARMQLQRAIAVAE